MNQEPPKTSVPVDPELDFSVRLEPRCIRWIDPDRGIRYRLEISKTRIRIYRAVLARYEAVCILRLP